METDLAVDQPKFTVIIQVKRDIYYASISYLSLVESGPELVPVCERIIHRAKTMTMVLRERGFYLPSPGRDATRKN
jgi:hypothetical protein